MSPRRARLPAIMTLWFATALIDVGIVNVTSPAIREDLDATRSDLQWVLSGYALSFGVPLIAAGRAGVFLSGMFVFAAASLATSLAPAAAWLNGARFVFAAPRAGGPSACRAWLRRWRWRSRRVWAASAASGSGHPRRPAAGLKRSPRA